ncbi:probable cytochrome P450 301a1, mitochondrial isoform X2 [Zootermopsis nevadensis]|uniref:Putative cytochrome P450 301a1, mitochondrial n=1 Tax=Zootermopsis nevadensis TaxID=136037 RepID=A0A067RSD6_ZOONE|nr:probable cytochrome P450 301a1, mitochondrial isoform X2 [Zootermopsis nevadensis]KDR23725.1 putative cytochrome P450 301a1, mitochondrial [Zootermopsis nevadensis]
MGIRGGLTCWRRAFFQPLTTSRCESSVVTTFQDDVGTEWDRARPYSEVPGPKPLPLVGNTWRFLPFVGNFSIEEIDRVSRDLYRQYGRVVKLAGLMGRPDMLFLYDADEIERVFRNEDLMPHRPSMPSLNYYKHVHRKDFFGDNGGVIAVHGENWYNFRTRVQQAMLQPRTAKLYTKPIEETAVAFVKRAKKLRDSNLEVPEDFLNEIHKWSLESIARVALDMRLGCLDEQVSCSTSDTQKLIDAVITFFSNVGILELKFPFWRIFSTPTWKKYIAALDTITDISMKHISTALQRLHSGGPVLVDNDSSLLQRVLATDSDPKTACILAIDMFLVGIDTTSTAVASILYQLSQHPEKQEILYDEIRNVLPSHNSSLTAQGLEKLVYLKACIKETLRMYPVVIGNGRCMTRDTVVAGYQIPKGVQAVFQHHVISNLDHYFPQPDEFLPERWLKICSKSRQGHHPFASLPFGYGRRMCLGRRFADLEIQMVIAKMIQTFRIEYHYEKLQYRIHPMYTPDGPLRFKLVERP